MCIYFVNDLDSWKISFRSDVDKVALKVLFAETN